MLEDGGLEHVYAGVNGVREHVSPGCILDELRVFRPLKGHRLKPRPLPCRQDHRLHLVICASPSSLWLSASLLPWVLTWLWALPWLSAWLSALPSPPPWRPPSSKPSCL